MPFELGLSVLHASQNPGIHSWFLFESVKWRIQKSLSDLNGTDSYIHDGTVDGVFRELAKAFIRADRQPSVQQMQFLYDKLELTMPRLLTDAAATDHSMQGYSKIRLFSRLHSRKLFRGIPERNL
jgi:hypothetical protein